MYVRLAFAVAAHLDPEILIVDEVLAVGDAEFQKKCLGKMGEVSKEGRTVLFVSHNMGAIKSLCSRAVFLENGKIKYNGLIEVAVETYFSVIETNNACWNREQNVTQLKNDVIEPVFLKVVDFNNVIIKHAVSREKGIYILLQVLLKKIVPSFTIGISIFDSQGNLVFRSLHTDEATNIWPNMKLGINTLKVRVPTNFMNAGFYRVVLDGGLNNIMWFYNPHVSDVAIAFGITETLSESPYWQAKREGIIAPLLQWKLIDD
jgi:lipopolysaccharide transport system ATP-binding protein